MWSFLADGRWLMEHVLRFGDLVPFNVRGVDRVPLQDVVFLADCIAFDHDMATLVRPLRDAPNEPPPVAPVVPSSSAYAGIDYFNAVEGALTMATDARFGDVVELRYYSDEPELPQFTRRFAGREDPLALYAMATRQVDVLSEFLCLYRVLETPNRDNGKALIERRLAEIQTHDFGELYTHDAATGRGPNVFEVYRRRALDRVARLTEAGMDTSAIAGHLYGVRNGLAHGKGSFLVSDYSGLSAVGEDLPIVKLLARMVVEGSPPPR
jgi:hypothetical protein